jgi:glycosyltransferase involved in cell wall biosynthesis
MITVVLPVHNGGALLGRCVDSLARQDSDAGAFDVVVLDNCSTDGSLDALNRLPASITRRVVRVDQLLPIEQNWGRIRDLTDVRPFITIIGHDDAFDPGFIRTMTRVLRREPDMRLLFCHFRLIDGDDRIVRSCRPMGSWESAGHFLAGRLANIRDSFGTGYVVRFDDYCAVGGIPRYEKLMYADDALWLMLARRSRIRILEEECFSYRLHATSTSQVRGGQMVLRSFSQYLDLLQELAPQDAGILRALSIYGAPFVLEMARYWVLEESNRANRAGETASFAYIAAWRDVCRRLFSIIGRSDRLDHDFSDEIAFSLWTNRHPVARRLWTSRPLRPVMRRVHKMLGAPPF